MPVSSTIRSPMRAIMPLVVALLVALALNPALAQDRGANAAAAERDIRNYALPAAGLAESLKALARQSGLTLSVKPSLVAGRQAPPVAGRLTADQVLMLLLAGQDMSGRIDDGSILIARRAEPAPAPAPARAGGREALDEINVTSATAAGTVKNLASAPASASVVTEEELEGRSYRDITDALQSVPGVYVDEGAAGEGGNQEISIRGWDPKYTKILVDGIPQSSQQGYYNGNGNGSEFGWLPPITAIERIEVIRGPMSSLYGSDAMGGVINVITKPVPDAWGGSVSVDQIVQDDRQSGDANTAQYYLGGPLIEDTLALTLFGERYDRDEDDIPNGFQAYTRESHTAKLAWTPDDANKLGLEVGYSTQDSTGAVDATGDDFLLERIRRHQTLTHEIAWGNGMRTRSFVQNVSMDNRSQNATYKRTSANTSTVMPFDTHVLTVGAYYRTQETENPDRALGQPNLQRWDMALFAEDEWYITDPFALITGLRYVDDENYGTKLVPRLYGVYTFNPEFTLKGGVSAGYRTPDLKEGDSNWLEGGGGPSTDGRDIGNSDLEPEESLTYEIGGYWTGLNRMNASLTVYHTDYDNKIEKPTICPRTPDGMDGFLFNCEYQGQFYQALFQYQNVEKAELQGVEATLGMPIGANIYVDTSYTYTRSEQLSGENRGQPLNNQPEHRANLGVTWRPTVALRVWSKARYRGETEFFGRGGPDDGTAPAYTLVDGGVNYDVNDSLAVYGGVYNLLDKTLRNEQFGRFLDGRRFNVGTTVNF